MAVVALAAPTAASAMVMPVRSAAVRVSAPGLSPRVQLWRFPYRTAGGPTREAYVIVPGWYEQRLDPGLPLVISPPGRGVPAASQYKLWGALPSIGGFAVVSPDSQGRRLPLFSWGAPPRIDDLARMPGLVAAALPWLQLAPHRVYAVGGSMGGQEVLLLIARHPRLLAGAVAFDSVANLAAQYQRFPQEPCDRVCQINWSGPVGLDLQRLARYEIGGTPTTDPAAYAERSPLHDAAAIAFSGVPLELLWSRQDQIVPDQQQAQSGALFAAIRRLNPTAPVEAIVGDWMHSHEQQADRLLPYALAQLALLPASYDHRPETLIYSAPTINPPQPGLAATPTPLLPLLGVAAPTRLGPALLVPQPSKYAAAKARPQSVENDLRLVRGPA
jgi:poly(3-hydroxybutyrate) depolymerase